MTPETPSESVERWQLILGDCVEVMRGMAENSVDAVVCDPPYLLGFMGKEFDQQGGAHLNPVQMQAWHEAWAREALRVLKPGGHLLAFGGTRTYHRLASAIEDAGFELRDSIHWLYGSGFPKSHNVGKAIDNHRGAPAGTDEEADEQTSEFNGWGTALKPSHEPIVVARKPLEGSLTVAENTLKWGTGGVNVDGCRVRTGPSPSIEKRQYELNSLNSEDNLFRSEGGRSAEKFHEYRPSEELGRWPPNLLLVHSPGCQKVRTMTIEDYDTYDCVPGCPVKELDRQSGILRSGTGAVHRESGKGYTPNAYGKESRPEGTPCLEYGDEGGASRFFPQFQWTEADFGFLYVAKANRGERELGCEEIEKKDLVFMSGPDGTEAPWNAVDKRTGRQRERFKVKVHNIHPTVKPVELCRWLVRLVTPTAGTLLDPFAGSGTTGCAALMEGFKFIGIEKEEEYAQIARARLTYWEKEGVKEQARITIEEKARREQTTLEAFSA